MVTQRIDEVEAEPLGRGPFLTLFRRHRFLEGQSQGRCGGSRTLLDSRQEVWLDLWFDSGLIQHLHVRGEGGERLHDSHRAHVIPRDVRKPHVQRLGVMIATVL